MSDEFVTGACLCGAVVFEATLPSLWCAHCHCTQCQRFHGAPVVTWVGFNSDSFRITVGENSLRWYRSSAPAQRGFCGDCGSSFLFQSERWPGEMHVCLTNLQGPIDREPESHVHYDTHVPWMSLADDLPRRV
jgi:hypothetical protein